MTILVTGGAGFIGSNFVLDWLSEAGEPVVNLDKLTYAGNLANLASLADDPRHRFVQGDIGDQEAVEALLASHRPRAVVHFAAESHVDRSIHGPGEFVQTNVVGTFRLLEAARGYWQSLAGAERDAFRFLHVSTDEVYGSLSETDPAVFRDHGLRAQQPLLGLQGRRATTSCAPTTTPTGCRSSRPTAPTTTARSSFPEKLIPLMIANALEGKPLPVYGDGRQVRDWLYVGDHCEAIRTVLAKGRPGEVYNIGGNAEKRNLEVVHALCDALGEPAPARGRLPRRSSPT